jgi:hypothetical protein
MSDKPYFHEPNQTIHLRVWALGQMVWGAFLAGAFLVGVMAVLAAIYFVGLLLPEESKQAPAPMGAVIVQSDEDLA